MEICMGKAAMVRSTHIPRTSTYHFHIQTHTQTHTVIPTLHTHFTNQRRVQAQDTVCIPFSQPWSVSELGLTLRLFFRSFSFFCSLFIAGLSMDDGRREKKRKESSKHPKEMSDRRDELRIFLLGSSDFSTFHHSLIHTSRALNGYTISTSPLFYQPHD